MYLFFRLTRSFSVVEDLFFVNFVRRVANGDTSCLNNNNITKHGLFFHSTKFYFTCSVKFQAIRGNYRGLNKLPFLISCIIFE